MTTRKSFLPRKIPIPIEDAIQISQLESELYDINDSIHNVGLQLVKLKRDHSRVTELYSAITQSVLSKEAQHSDSQSSTENQLPEGVSRTLSQLVDTEEKKESLTPSAFSASAREYFHLHDSLLVIDPADNNGQYHMVCLQCGEGHYCKVN
jgi:hypothetical protein